MMTILLDAALDLFEGRDPLWFRLTDEAKRDPDSDALDRRDLYVRMVEMTLATRIEELAEAQGYDVEAWTSEEAAGIFGVVTTSTPRPGDEEYRSIEMDLWQEAWDTIDLEAIRAVIKQQTRGRG